MRADGEKYVRKTVRHRTTEDAQWIVLRNRCDAARSKRFQYAFPRPLPENGVRLPHHTRHRQCSAQTTDKTISARVTQTEHHRTVAAHRKSGDRLARRVDGETPDHFVVEIYGNEGFVPRVRSRRRVYIPRIFGAGQHDDERVPLDLLEQIRAPQPVILAAGITVQQPEDRITLAGFISRRKHHIVRDAPAK